MEDYDYVEKLGSGGYGEVWRVRIRATGVECALKRLTSFDGESAARFQREVRYLGGFDHQNVIKVWDSQLSEIPYFFTMPLYHTTLEEELEKGIAPERRAKVFESILQAVRYIHEQGCSHRDIKPSNVLMNSDDDIVLADFGLARLPNLETSRLTTSGDPQGSFAYAAPEQLRGLKEAGKPSDIFALGRVLYELYGGDVFGTQDLSQLSADIAVIVERCTRTVAAVRFPSIEQLLTTFRAVTDAHATDRARVQLHTLAGTLAAADSCSSEEAAKLGLLLAQVEKNPDEILKAMRILPGAAFKALEKSDFDLSRRLMRLYAHHVTSQQWGYDMLDDIVAVSVRAFEALQDTEMKAECINSVLMLATKQDRWSAFADLESMLDSVESLADRQYFASRMKGVVGWDKCRAVARRHLRVSKQPEPFRELFSPDTPEPKFKADGTREP